MVPDGGRRRAFGALHERGTFVIANAWDAGSARVLAGLGFPALATSSAAAANTLGRNDGRITREESIAHAHAITEAVDIPVSADLEKCFSDAPEEVAETIRLAAEADLAGGWIEDATGDKRNPRYDFDAAVARVAAAARAAHAMDAPFVLTARTENFINGFPDLEDTIRRLKAFEQAGADVLMAPGLPDLESVGKVCRALSKPFSFMVGIPGKSFTLRELEAAGVRRISVATSLYRAAMTGLIAAAREIREQGTFGYVDANVPGRDFSRYMRPG